MFAVCIRMTGGNVHRVDRAWEASAGCAPTLLRLFNPRMAIAAIVFGHVIIAIDAAAAARLRAHEHTHVRQYERWGVFFPFAYAFAGLIAKYRGANAYLDNYFEREAFLAEDNKIKNIATKK